MSRKKFYFTLLINSFYIFFLITLSQGAGDTFWYPTYVFSDSHSITSPLTAGFSKYSSTVSPMYSSDYYTDIYSTYYSNMISANFLYPFSNVTFYDPPPSDDLLWQVLKQSSLFSFSWNDSIPAPSDFRASYPLYGYNYKGPIEIHLTWNDNSTNEEGFIINYFCGYNSTDPCGHMELPPNKTELTLPVTQAPRRPTWVPTPDIISFSIVAFNAEGETKPVKAGVTMTDCGCDLDGDRLWW